jgi:NAD+ synthase (glutamine-hydrolysing)
MSRLTIAIPQFRPRKGALQANLDRVGELLAESAALDPRPQVVVFAETILSGYFVEGGVREMALTVDELAGELEARYRARVTDGAPLDVILGFYESLEGTLHNSAACIALRPDAPARVLHVHRKNFLPTYALFDEERFVERGYGIRAFDTSWGRAAILVCEDAWHSLSGTIAALDGAQAIFVLAAAPARGPAPREDGVPGPGSVARWERLIRDIAEEQGVFCVLANLVGSEGGRMFQGGSVVAGPRGDVRVRAPVFEEAMLTATLDTGDLARVRADLPMLSDLKAALPFLRTELDRALLGAAGGAGSATVPGEDPARDEVRQPPPARITATREAARPARRSGAKAKRSGPAPLPLVTGGEAALGQPPVLDIDAALVEQWLVAFLRDEFARRGFTKAIVGLSGGVDSAVVAALAARALGPENVIAVRMPYRTSSPDSLAHAQLLIDQLGIESRTVDISGGGGRVSGARARRRHRPPRQRDGAHAHDRAVRPLRQAPRAPARHRQQERAPARLLHVACGRLAAGEPHRRSVQDAGLGAGRVARRARRDRREAGERGPRGRPDGRGGFRRLVCRGRRCPQLDPARLDTDELEARGMDRGPIRLVTKRLDSTHWKRKLPTVAMLSGAAIGESYLRPVDY